jgi:hypothetical protein
MDNRGSDGAATKRERENECEECEAELSRARSHSNPKIPLGSERPSRRNAMLWISCNQPCCEFNFLVIMLGASKVEALIWLEISDCSYSETRFALTKNTRRK